MAKNIVVNIVFILSLFFIFNLVSCGGGGGGSGDDDKPVLAFANIENAKSLYIIGGSNEYSSKLIKIINNGISDSAEEIILNDENGNEISIKNKHDYSLWPTYVKKLNDSYIFLGLGYLSSSYEQTCQLYLCRNSDGKCIRLKDPEGEYSDEMATTGFLSRVPQKDDYGNIYFEGNSKLRKIDLFSINSTAKMISCPSLFSDDFISFIVNKYGDILYTKNDLGGSYIYRRSTLFGLSPETSSVWKGFDGHFYSQEFISNEPTKPIKRITIVNTPEEIHYDIYSDNDFLVSCGSAPNSINISGYTYIVGPTIKEIYNPGSSPRELPLAGLTISEVYAVASTEEYYFIAGKDSSSRYFIIKVTPGTSDYEYLLGDGYKVQNMVASKWNGITFSAERMNDGKIILGNISDSGNMTILDSITGIQRIISLEAIR